MLEGIDISQHQSTTPSLDGLSFIVLRSSIATSRDTRYAEHYAKARKAGLVTMAYHFAYSADQSPIARQVETFLDVAKDADFLWLDQEEQGFNNAQAQEFIDLVRASGRPCGLYHSSTGFGGVNADAKWVADWRTAAVNAGHPLSPDGTREFPAWDLWQYRGAPLDLDYANPDRPLAALLRRGFVPKADYDSLAAAYDHAQAEIGRIEYEIRTREGHIDRLVQERDAALEQLAAAPGIERERIALAEGQRVASRIRTT